MNPRRHRCFTRPPPSWDIEDGRAPPLVEARNVNLRRHHCPIKRPPPRDIDDGRLPPGPRGPNVSPGAITRLNCIASCIVKCITLLYIVWLRINGRKGVDTFALPTVTQVVPLGTRNRLRVVNHRSCGLRVARFRQTANPKPSRGRADKAGEDGP